MGSLSNYSAPHLGSVAAKSAIAEAGISATDIEEVYMGQVIQAGSGQAPARQVALNSGCSHDTPSTTINKVCASGMKSVMMAAQAIRAGDRHIMMAGGMEAMSKAPHLSYARRATAYGNYQVMDSIQSDTLTDVYN
jgi:acetyl-CoA C-acetyltransferase